jgi:hypothetical protein
MLQYGTAAERAAAGQEILNYMIEGGLSTGQQFQGMAMRTAEAQKEQEANTRLLNTELAKYGTNADRAATGQANLNAMIEDGVTSGADFEDVARRTAEAQYLQSVNTDLAEAALSKYHFTVGQVLDDLSDDTKWSTGIDSLKESLMGLDFKDDPLTKWLNEKDADAREAGQRIMAELKAALEVDPNIDPLVWLEDLKKNAPPEVRKVIEQIQQDLKDNPLDVPTKIEPPSLADLEAELAALQFAIDRNKFVGTGELDTTDMEKRAREIELTLGINLPVSVTGIEGPGGVKEQIQTIATAQATTVTYDAVYNPSYNDIVSRKSVMAEPIKSTVTWTAAYNPDYNTMIMRAGWLSEDLEPKVTWTANYNPDYNTMIMRMGWLSEDASPDINVYQHWPQGGYQGYKDRYDYLTRNQAVTITYRTAGATSIPSGLKTSAAALNATGARVVIPPITIPQPVNLVRVTVDGRELRSVVRDEIRQAMPEPAAVR